MVACRADLLAELTDHLLGVNEVADVTGDAAKAAFMHEVYNRAYTIHVLVSALPGWRLSGPAGIISADDEASVLATIQAFKNLK
jgi:hypothetical protein